MARKMNAKTDMTEGGPVLHNIGARADLINNTFRQIFAAEQDIAALMKEHIEPLKKERKRLWRQLKADTGIDRTDFDLFYKLYKRDRMAADFEDDVRNAIRDNCREIFAALKKGEQMDWIVASDAAGAVAH